VYVPVERRFCAFDTDVVCGIHIHRNTQDADRVPAFPRRWPYPYPIPIPFPIPRWPFGNGIGIGIGIGIGNDPDPVRADAIF
jgi:hypothetical protein